MDRLRLSQDDVVHHTASIGLDIHPPIDMKNERTRLTLFFEDAREKWPELYEQLIVGETEFRISKPFREMRSRPRRILPPSAVQEPPTSSQWPYEVIVNGSR